MTADLPQSSVEKLREKIERLVGTAILKNDKNYTNDIMQDVTAEIGAALDKVDTDIIGPKEYYYEHYPFVRTKKMQEEVDEKIARDEQRHKQRQALAELRNHFGIGEDES